MGKKGLKRILVVDDDCSDRLLMKKLLSKKYRVIEACDGNEAVDLVRNRQPDLVLMDIMMPNLDGYSACYMIKTDPLTAKTPVIMLTGLKDELNIKLAKEMYANGYLIKSSNPYMLEHKINQFFCSSE